MMTLTDFRNLSQEEQLRYVELLLLGQNPHLRVGDRMEGPVQAFKRGKTFIAFGDMVPKLSEAVRIQVQPQDILDGHPFVNHELLLEGNWLHLYTVSLSKPFGSIEVGSPITVFFQDQFSYAGTPVPSNLCTDIILTQEMVDAETTVNIQFCVSS